MQKLNLFITNRQYFLIQKNKMIPNSQIIYWKFGLRMSETCPWRISHLRSWNMTMENSEWVKRRPQCSEVPIGVHVATEVKFAHVCKKESSLLLRVWKTGITLTIISKSKQFSPTFSIQCQYPYNRIQNFKDLFQKRRDRLDQPWCTKKENNNKKRGSFLDVVNVEIRF